jgi:hypothetical protein
MSTFDDDFAAVDDLFGEVFGTEEIIVTEPDGSTEHTYDADVLDERVESRETDLGTEIVVTREVVIQCDSDGREDDGIPTVLNLRGTVTIGGIVYAIESITHSRSGQAVLHTKRISASERGRDSYRRRNQ